jgi:hypothetical protein
MNLGKGYTRVLCTSKFVVSLTLFCNEKIFLKNFQTFSKQPDQITMGEITTGIMKLLASCQAQVNDHIVQKLHLYLLDCHSINTC